jgi:hypothetical protein
MATMAAAHLPHQLAANRSPTPAVFMSKMSVFAITSLICCHTCLFIIFRQQTAEVIAIFQSVSAARIFYAGSFF